MSLAMAEPSGRYDQEFQLLEMARALELVERVAVAIPDDHEDVVPNLGFILERRSQLCIMLHDDSRINLVDLQPGIHYKFRVKRVMQSQTILSGRVFLVLPRKEIEAV